MLGRVLVALVLLVALGLGLAGPRVDAQSNSVILRGHEGGRGAYVTHSNAVYMTIVGPDGTHVAVTSSGQLSTSATSSVSIGSIDLHAVGHISSVTHVAGLVGLRSHDGARGVFVTHANALSVDCPSCSNVTTINTLTHITSALHVEGVVSLRSHDGARGAFITHSNALLVELTGGGSLNISHISAAVHLAGGSIAIRSSDDTNRFVRVTHGNALLVEAAGNTSLGNIQHISSVVHVVGAKALPVVQSPDEGAWPVVAHQGGTWAVSATQSNPWTIAAAHQGGNWTIQHAVVHAYGALRVLGAQGLNYVHVNTSGQLQTNCTGCPMVNQSGSWTIQAAHQGGVWNTNHISSVVHVSAARPLQVTQSPEHPLWNVTAHSSAAFNIAHITGAVHLAGNVVDQLHSALRVTNVTVNTVQGTIGHVTSTTHIIGSVRLIDQAGNLVSVTSNALDVNCTGCSAATVVAVSHVASVTHVAGGIWIRDGGSTRFAHVNASGALLVNATDSSHVASTTHIAGTVALRSHTGGRGVYVNHANALYMTLVGSDGQPASVNGSGQLATSASVTVDTISHLTSTSHVSGGVYLFSHSGSGRGAYINHANALQVTVVGTDGNPLTVSGGVANVQATQGSTWNITNTSTLDHVTSVLHVAAARPFPVVQSPQQALWNVTAHQGGTWSVGGSGAGNFVVSQGTAGNALWPVVAHQGGTWNVGHVSSTLHVAAARPLPVVQSPEMPLWHVTAHQGGGWNVSANQSNVWNVTAHQGGVWSITHVSSTTHVAGIVRLRSNESDRGVYVSHANALYTTLVGATPDHVAAVNSSGQLEVNCTGCSASSVVNVGHVSAVTHVAAASPFRVVQAPESGQWNISAHQAGSWTVAHVSSTVHVTTTNSAPVHVVASTSSDNLVCHTSVAIHQTAVSGLIAHGSTGLRMFICSVVLVAESAQNISIVEGTGLHCGASMQGVIGAGHASIALAANGGFSSISPFPWIGTKVAGNQLCLRKSLGTGAVSGTITYRGAP